LVPSILMTIGCLDLVSVGRWRHLTVNLVPRHCRCSVVAVLRMGVARIHILRVVLLRVLAHRHTVIGAHLTWWLLVASGAWHQHLAWVVGVHSGLALWSYDCWVNLAWVVSALDCCLLLCSEDLFQGVLFLYSLGLLAWVLMNRRMLRRGWVFRLDVAWRNSFLLVGAWCISLDIFGWYVTRIACLSVSNQAWVVAQALSWSRLFGNVLWGRSFNLFVLSDNLLFFVLLAINILLFQSPCLLWLPVNTSFYTFSDFINSAYRNIAYWSCDLLFLRIQLFDSFINEFSVFFQV